MTDALVTVQNESPVAAPQIQREVLIDERTAPLVVESPAVEVVTVGQETSVVAQVPEMHVITVGEAGPAGPAGPAGSGTTISKTAGVALGGHRAVVLDATEHAIYADSSDLTHRDKVLGITTGAVVLGDIVTIQTYGEITEPSWAWIPDTPVFLGLTGLLTQTPPSVGFSQRIGFPTAATKLFVDIDSAVTL